MFSSKHDEQLYEFFAGVYDGRCGLRSHLGGMLEALKNGDVEHGPRTSDCMPVKPQSRHANRDFDVTEDMMDAARKSRRIEATLRTMETRNVHVLMAHYSPRPSGLDRDPVLDVLFGDEARDVVRQSRAEDREEKRAGKKALSSMEHQARTALELAQEAYVVACDAVAATEREERQGRFAAGLHGA
jgi:hypothetical protein